MNIGIIGSGVVGQTLGTGLVRLGHSVQIGTREPEKLAEWVAEQGALASAGSVAEAAAFGELVILATGWSGTEAALGLAGADNLAGKVLIDVTNPLQFGADGPALAVGLDASGGELVQGWAPSARVVKAFNSVGAPFMIQPDLLGDVPDMFIAGDDAAAKAEVTRLAEAFGWPVIDLGGIGESRLLEALAMIWIRFYVQTQSGMHAFKLLRA